MVLRRFPNIDEFSDMLEGMVKDVPPIFLRGLAGIWASPEEKYDPSLGAATLGEYIVEPPFDPYINIYYASFRRLLGRASRREIEREMWETLIHEIRHHLEERAGVDYLAIEDLKNLMLLKRKRGLPKRHPRPKNGSTFSRRRRC